MVPHSAFENTRVSEGRLIWGTVTWSVEGGDLAGGGDAKGDPIPDTVDPPPEDLPGGGDEKGDPIPDTVDPPPKDLLGGGDVKGDPIPDHVDPPPRPIDEPPPTWVFDEVTIEGRVNRGGETPVPPPISIRFVTFEIGLSKSVEFADLDSALADINKVLAILKKDPKLHVKITGFVGLVWLIPESLRPRGRSPEAQKGKMGDIMDARAKKVGDLLVGSGVAPERIELSRGAVETGSAGHRADLEFFRK